MNEQTYFEQFAGLTDEEEIYFLIERAYRMLPTNCPMCGECLHVNGAWVDVCPACDWPYEESQP